MLLKFVFKNYSTGILSVMQQIMLEGVYGPREILPQSMWTGLTRDGEGAKSWQKHVQRAAAGFSMSQAGVWLPLPEHSSADYDALANHVFSNGNADRESQEVVQAVTVEEDGCWSVPETTDTHAAMTTLTELDTHRGVLEAPEHAADIRQCNSANCVYHRHYDITLDVPSNRRALLYPNTLYFTERTDDLLTAWGNVLPSPDVSRKNLQKFQKACAPHTTSDESLLTMGGISQISLIPSTGCWFTRSYYMTPVGVSGYENWQYDGYGRLKIPSKRAEMVKYGSYAMLGHRAVWATLGNKTRNSKNWALNHMCGFRPCCNPAHLVEVSNQTNALHGSMMTIARGMMEGVVDIKEGVKYLKHKARRQKIDPKNIDEFWNSTVAATA